TTPGSCGRCRTTAASGSPRRPSTATSASGPASSTTARATTTCARWSTWSSSSGRGDAARYPRTVDELEDLEAEGAERVEARLQALLDAIPDLMFRIRSDGTYVDFAGEADLLANP